MARPVSSSIHQATSLARKLSGSGLQVAVYARRRLLSRAVAAKQIPEHRLAEMRQFVKANQRRTVRPGSQAGLFVLEIGEADLGPGGGG